MSRKTSILEELTMRNLSTINRANDGWNTSQSDWPEVGAWVTWDDFTAEKLCGMFAAIVESEWTIRGIRATPTDWDAEFFDEDELEHSVITQHIFPPVNAALRHALKHVKLDKVYDLNLGRGGRTYYEPGGDRRFKADWALCSAHHKQDPEYGGDRYYNLLPGDTKLSNKWHSSWHGDPDTSKRNLWEDPVRQVLHYCERVEARYGFLITDKELVVMRMTPQPTGTGLAASRPPRQQPARGQQGHSYHASTSTNVSALSASMRDVSMNSASSYRPTGPATDGYMVEYQAIPMEDYGRGKRHLTVQLALFYLAWIAGVGDNELLPSYPSFDSSWPLMDGTLLHNTMGMVLKKTKELDYPNPSAERGPKWISIGGQDDGEDIKVLTLQSALTLEITEHKEKHFYYFLDGDEPVLVTSTVPIYDEASGEYGYLDGLIWNFGAVQELPSKPSKPGESLSKKHVQPGKKHRR